MLIRMIVRGSIDRIAVSFCFPYICNAKYLSVENGSFQRFCRLMLMKYKSGQNAVVRSYFVKRLLGATCRAVVTMLDSRSQYSSASSVG